MTNIFTKHPNSINETYVQHFKFAFCFGVKMLLGSLACITHAIFPFVFERTGTNTVNALAEICQQRCRMMDEAKNKENQ